MWWEYSGYSTITTAECLLGDGEWVMCAYLLCICVWVMRVYMCVHMFGMCICIVCEHT